MADGFIVRKGGVAVDITAAPSINFVSKTFDSITFTITNNDVLTADIFWEIGDSTPDANTFSLASGATSNNQVASGLVGEETYTIFAFANAEGKAGSQTTSQVRTTPEDTRVFTAATGGTTLEYNLDSKRFRSHTFLEDGNFVVSTVGDNVDDRNKVDYLIIAGGGAGGGDGQGGGGGAGGYQTTLGTSGADSLARDKVVITAQNHSIFVGAGATAPITNNPSAVSGNNSLGLGVTCTGGGGGGSFANSGSVGGSGGGGGASQSGTAQGFGGNGTANQGRNGGNGVVGDNRSGGGGGGAFAVGESGAGLVAGVGGNGLANILRTGLSETRGGGGAGGSRQNTTVFSGGTGGGGNTATSGTANTGGGGGGSRNGVNTPIGNGGSGIVVIRYEIAPSV